MKSFFGLGKGGKGASEEVAVSISAPTPTSPVATAGGPALARDDGGTNLPSAQDVENFVKGKATNVTIKVPDLFLFLLTKLQVEPELLRETASAYTDQEKLLIVGDCTSVLADDTAFNKRDEEMMQRLRKTRVVDSIRLLAFKYRICNSSEEWRRAFCDAGGVVVLVNMMLNRIDATLIEVDAAALYQVLLCLRHIIKTDGMNAIIYTRGAIESMCGCIDFTYPGLSIQILELLSVLVAYGGPDAVWQVKQGMRGLAKKRDEKVYACFADGIINQSIDVQSAILLFMNALLLTHKELEQRLSLRNELIAAKFHQAVYFLVDIEAPVGVKGFSKDMAATLELQRDVAAGGAVGKSTEKTPLQRAYIDRYGSSWSQLADLMGEGTAEDKKTRICPSEGVMAGLCLESKKTSKGVKERWYHLDGTEFKWYFKDAWAKGEKENGKISMLDVQEVMDHNTAENLQTVARHGFIILTSSNVGKQFQIGVCDENTKKQWITALRKAHSEAIKRRFAFRVGSKKIPADEFTLLEKAMLNHVNVYHLLSGQDTAALKERLEEAGDLATDKDADVGALLLSHLFYELVSTGYKLDAQNLLRTALGQLEKFEKTGGTRAIAGAKGVDNGANSLSKAVAANKLSILSAARAGAAAMLQKNNPLDANPANSSPADAASEVGELDEFGERRRRFKEKSATRLSIPRVAQGDSSSISAPEIQVASKPMSSDPSLSTEANSNSVITEAVEVIAAPTSQAPDAMEVPNLESNTRPASGALPQVQQSSDDQTGSAGEAANSGVEPSGDGGGKGALMAMLAARGPRLPPPPRPANDDGGAAGGDGGGDGRGALMAMIAARGPRLPPPPRPQGVDDGSSAAEGGNDEGSGGRGALMAMIAARGPRLPPPPGAADAGGDGGEGRSALMSMIAARGPRLPPPPGAGGADGGGDTEGRGALMSMIAARGPRLPPPPGAAGGDGGPRPRLALPPRGKTPEQLAAEAAAKAAEEAENAKYPPKPAYNPSMKMRGLFWTKMKGSETADTVWSTVEEEPLPWSELEALFGDDKAGKVTLARRPAANDGTGVESEAGENSTELGAAGKSAAPKNVALFDSKRVQNVSIAIKKLKMTPKEVADASIKLDPAVMTKAVIDCIQLIAPTEDEINMLDGHQGSPDDLDLTGRIFHELRSIPRLNIRLDIMKTTLEWMNGFEQLSDEVDVLDHSVDELQSKATEGRLKKVLGTVLAAGNYMNSGTGRAQAHGVRLDVLVKLANMKQNNDPKQTLLHYVVKKTMQDDPSGEEFCSSWANLWNAPKISLRQLETDLRGLSADLNKMKAERTKCNNETDASKFTSLIERIQSFLSQAEPKLASLQTRVAAVSSKIQKARAYYGHVNDPNSGECQNAAFFGLITSFGTMYMKCKDEIINARIEAEKKAKAEADKAARQGNQPPPPPGRRPTLGGGAAMAFKLPDITRAVAEGSSSGKNVFDKLKEAQSQNPLEMIAAFKAINQEPAALVVDHHSDDEED